MQMWAERDLIELYEERAAILEHDAKLPRKEAEKQAYWQWRQLVGQGVPAPKRVQEIVMAARV
jgi:hypothetical protein